MRRPPYLFCTTELRGPVVDGRIGDEPIMPRVGSIVGGGFHRFTVF